MGPGDAQQLVLCGSSPSPQEELLFDWGLILGKRSCQAWLPSSQASWGHLLFPLSGSDVFYLEAKVYKSVTSLKPATVGNLGKHISISRWITIVWIFGESHFVFQRGLKGKAGLHGAGFSMLEIVIWPCIYLRVLFLNTYYVPERQWGGEGVETDWYWCTLCSPRLAKGFHSQAQLDLSATTTCHGAGGRDWSSNHLQSISHTSPAPILLFP